MSALKSILNIASIATGARRCTPEQLAAESEQEQLDSIMPPALPREACGGDADSGADGEKKES